MTKYGICEKCMKWGETPSNFNEGKHFLKCECGSLMFLQIHDPKKAGYRDKDKIVITIKGQ